VTTPQISKLTAEIARLRGQRNELGSAVEALTGSITGYIIKTRNDLYINDEGETTTLLRCARRYKPEDLRKAQIHSEAWPKSRIVRLVRRTK